MTQTSNTLLSRLSDYLADQMGLYFPRQRWPDLERGILSAAKEFDFTDAQSFIVWLLSCPLTKSRIEILSSHLTIGETYFFREKRAFEILEQQILPELVRSRRGAEQRLRIWSAACCTGEEPYSIAILLDRLIPDLHEWQITILATDINPQFFRKAIQGVYTPWSFRDTQQWLQEKYFTKTRDGLFEILPSIKKRVTFYYLNLAEDSYPSLINNTNGMDLVLCRNVLMYFAPERARKVVQNLHRSLLDGGWLVAGLTEASRDLFAEFSTVTFPGAILFQKNAVKPLSHERTIFVQTQADVVISAAPSSISNTASQIPIAIPSPRNVVSDDSYQEALMLYQEGRYAETAEKLLMFLSEQQTKKGDALALLARAYANQGKMSEALESCEKAIEADKLNAAMHYLYATILQEIEEIDQSVASLRRALYLDHRFALAHFTLATLTLQQGKFKESERHFINAVDLLKQKPKHEILPESEGITAGRLLEIIQSRRLQ